MLTDCCQPYQDQTVEQGLLQSTQASQLRTNRLNATRRSIISLTSNKSHKAKVNSLKLSKDVEQLTQVSSKKSIDSSQLKNSISLLSMSKDEQIRKLQQQNERYAKLIEAELGPLKQRYAVLKKDYLQKMNVLDKLQLKLVKIEKARRL